MKNTLGVVLLLIAMIGPAAAQQTDDQTGDYEEQDRRYFERYLSATFDRARLSRLPVTVMVFDIDHFKVYNDRFGHAAGDEILREAVALLRSCIRPTDRVCRIGANSQP